MEKEFEVISHEQLQHINAFMVRLQERVTHLHRELEIGYILEGSITVSSPQETSVLKTGDCFLLNRMEPHSFSSEGSGALLIALQFSSRLTEGFQAPGTHFRYEGPINLKIALEKDPDSYSMLCAIGLELTYSFLRKAPSDEFRCFSLSAALVHQLHKLLPWTVLNSEDYAAIKQRANRVMAITDYVDRNFNRELLLTEIAEKENLSLTYLSHFFKDTLGMSFQEYLNQKRFEYACQLLFGTDRTVLDISLSSGFSDVRYFNKSFEAQYGCTPREYRKGTRIHSSRLQDLEKNNQYIFTAQDSLRMLEPLHEQVLEKYRSHNILFL